MVHSDRISKLVYSISRFIGYLVLYFWSGLLARRMSRIAEQGVAEAQAILGVSYSKGIGVRKDSMRAFKCFQEAACKGNTSALFILGTKFAVGDGVAQNYKEASRLYRIAAAKKHPKAQAALGIMYVNGMGVRKNYICACALFNLALLGGFSEIRTERDLLLSQMSPKQIVLVKKLTQALQERVD